MPPRTWLALALAAIVALVNVSPARATADADALDVSARRDAPSARASRGAIKWLRSAGLYDHVRARVETRDYSVRPVAAGFAAANAGQRLNAEFWPAGIAITPAASGEWWSHLQLVGVGRGEAIAPVGRADVAGSGHRVELRYASGLVEWYENAPGGIEQGFSVPGRPAPGSAAALELVMAVRGDLVPSLAPSGDEVQLTWPDGRAAIGYRDLRVWDARGRALASRMAVDAGRVRLIVDDREAVYPVTVDPVIYDAATLTPTGGQPDDEFGWSIAMASNTAVVGAPSRGSEGVYRGSAFVFTRQGNGSWLQQAELTAGADGKNLDSFGEVVGIASNGNTVIVGAPGTDLGDERRDAGAVYVFTRNGTTWTRQAVLSASDGVGGDNFGSSASIGGDTVVVGAPGHDPGGKPLGGAAYVFTRTGTTWTQRAKLAGGGNFQAGDAFGFAVAVSKSSSGATERTILVGAPFFHQGVVGPQVGRVTVFVGSGATWTKQTNLSPSDGDNGDAFGFAVAIDGNVAIVGAPGHDIGDKTQAGQAYVFQRSGTVWSQQTVLRASDPASGDQLGVSVDIGPETAVVGAPLHDVTGGACASTCDAAGQVYVFVRDGTTWRQQGSINARPPAPQQFFGFAVALDGSAIAVGAPFHAADAAAGPAYVFAPGTPIGNAKVWVGLKNSDAVGLRLDLKADVWVDGVWIASGVLDDVSAGSSGFNNAFLRTIPLYTVGSSSSFSGDVTVTVSVRAACSGTGQLTGVPRLWYNGRFIDTGNSRDAGSRVELPGRLFLRNGFLLSPSAGILAMGINQPVDSNQPCPGRQFLPFGTWSEFD